MNEELKNILKTYRIPKSICNKIDKKLENGEYLNESELIREALRDFFKEDKPRRIEGVVDAFNVLIAKGPKAFAERLKELEDGDER